MVVLDSNHTHEHVLSELEIYSNFVTKDCFMLVLDTVIDDLNIDPDRPWGPGSSPKSAVKEFMLKNSGDFSKNKVMKTEHYFPWHLTDIGVRTK